MIFLLLLISSLFYHTVPLISCCFIVLFFFKIFETADLESSGRAKGNLSFSKHFLIQRNVSFVPSPPFLIFSGGMPRASYGDRHCISIIHSKTHEALDFTSRIIDFFVIREGENHRGREMLPNTRFWFLYMFFFYIYFTFYLSYNRFTSSQWSKCVSVSQVSRALLWFWWRRSWSWWICRLRGGPSSRRPTWCHYTVQPSPARTTSPPSRSNCGRGCKLREPSRIHTTPRRYETVCTQIQKY